MFSDDIQRFVIEVITVGGGAAAIAYGIFVWLGKKWLEGKFAERLEAFKHEHTLQLEQYKYEINSLFNRVSKIHEREFEVLPTAWSKLQEAVGQVAQFTNPLQQYPDLDNMSETQVEEVLAKTGMTESQKEGIRHSDNRNQAYIKTIFWYDLNEAKKSVRVFHNYLLYKFPTGRFVI